jgi:trans-aconitate methyltransferase
MVSGDKLHSAPLSSPKELLDLGTGSGNWALEMADKYESATVIGVEIAPVQPSWSPPNCFFEVLDIEDEWLLKKSYDFIHARELLLSIRDFPRLFAQAYDHLKPGGYFEMSSSIAAPQSDDGSLSPDASLLATSKLFFDMG